MKKLLAFTLLLTLLTAACKETTTTTTTVNDTTKVAVDPTNVDTTSTAVVPGDTNGTDSLTGDNARKPDPVTTIYRLTVSFISIGEGIDYKAKAKYDTFLKDFAKRNKVKEISHETVGWGREGEVDYCFKLGELKELQQAAFVEESKALLNGNQLVQFKEKAACRKPR